MTRAYEARTVRLDNADLALLARFGQLIPRLLSGEIDEHGGGGVELKCQDARYGLQQLLTSYRSGDARVRDQRPKGFRRGDVINMCTLRVNDSLGAFDAALEGVSAIEIDGSAQVDIPLSCTDAVMCEPSLCLSGASQFLIKAVGNLEHAVDEDHLASVARDASDGERRRILNEAEPHVRQVGIDAALSEVKVAIRS